MRGSGVKEGEFLFIDRLVRVGGVVVDRHHDILTTRMGGVGEGVVFLYQ